jgi:DNA-binding beta-propeller fold protein YncE
MRLLFALLGLLLAGGCSRGTQSPAEPFVALQFVGEWGEAGDGPGKLSLPLSITADSEGWIYIADAGSRYIHQFDAQGHLAYAFTNERLERPTGIAVASGQIYVSDYSAERLFIFSSAGKLLQEIAGPPERHFLGPVSVAVDGEGFIYALEFDGHRVQKFDAAGRFVQHWGRDGEAPGEFHYPVDLAIGPDGYLYVADTHNRRIQKFTREGEFFTAWGKPGTASEQMDDVTGLAFFGGNFLVVADSGNRRLQIWTLAGQHLHTEDLRAHVGEGMESPADVAADNQFGLFVLDPPGRRVLRFRIYGSCCVANSLGL